MAGVSSGRGFLALFSRVIVGHTSFQTKMMDYIDDVVADVLAGLNSTSGIIATPVRITVSGSAGTYALTIVPGQYRFLAGNQLGYLDPAETLGCDPVPFDAAATQYVGLALDTYPEFTDVGTDNTVGYKHMTLGVGKRYTPSAVVAADDAITLTVTGIPLWTNAAATRPVKVFLVNPVTGSGEAIYTGELVVSGGALKVVVPHYLGQVVPSTTATDYVVFVAGPVVSATSLSSATHALVGTVTAGTPPTIAYTGQTAIKNLVSIKTILANVITQLGTAPDDTDDSQLATVIKALLLTAGHWTDNIQVGWNADDEEFTVKIGTRTVSLSKVGYVMAHTILATGGVYTGSLASLVERISSVGDATFRKLSSSAGLTTANGAADAAYGSSHYWAAVCNAVGGRVKVPFTSTNKLEAAGANVEAIFINNSTIDEGSRVHVGIEFATSATQSPRCTQVVTGTGVFIYLINTGSADIESDVYVTFDVINPA